MNARQQALADALLGVVIGIGLYLIGQVIEALTGFGGLLI